MPSKAGRKTSLLSPFLLSSFLCKQTKRLVAKITATLTTNPTERTGERRARRARKKKARSKKPFSLKPSQYGALITKYR
jgi:hypothetical protein